MYRNVLYNQVLHCLIDRKHPGLPEMADIDNKLLLQRLADLGLTLYCIGYF